MQNLDKLEQDMHVDKWAEIIRERDEKDRKELEKKNGGPLPRRAPKMEKYVFTIKIIEAEDLKACDINGFSDPYVVLGDEFQKRLAKTRIVYRNLNPRWDETIDIITTGPLNIVATIWDWDRLGDHDCVGRTSLKLDPSMFRDFMPREYWLDLDTQGRLLIRASMEGERDDIQFYFGKAFRALKRTERDMTRSITDKVSSCDLSISSVCLRLVSSPHISVIFCLARDSRVSSPKDLQTLYQQHSIATLDVEDLVPQVLFLLLKPILKTQLRLCSTTSMRILQ
jgi:hypothetical protein